MKDILATGLLFPEGPAVLSDGTKNCIDRSYQAFLVEESARNRGFELF